MWLVHRELEGSTTSDEECGNTPLATTLLEMKKNTSSTVVDPFWEMKSLSNKNSPPLFYYINHIERKVSLHPPSPMPLCKGGLLCDDMGMGKTIMMLSLFLVRKHSLPLRLDNRCTASTLVVCPLSLLHQWEAEIMNRTSSLSVLPYYEKSTCQQLDLDILLQYDVILTTYGKLSAEFSKKGSQASLHQVVNKIHVINFKLISCIEMETSCFG